LAAALDIEDRLGIERDDEGAGHARRAAARLALAPRPWQRGAVCIGRIGGGEHERAAGLVGSQAAQPLDRAREREPRAAEPLDEVAPPRRAERLQVRELAIERRETTGDALGEHGL